MKTKNSELKNAELTIARLASKGNRLAQSLHLERTHLKENHIREHQDGFDLVFYYNPEKSASWGTHQISFRDKSFTNETPCYTFEQHQVRFLESEVSVYQNFIKDFFELLTELTEGYRSRNPLNEYNCDY